MLKKQGWEKGAAPRWKLLLNKRGRYPRRSPGAPGAVQSCGVVGMGWRDKHMSSLRTLKSTQGYRSKEEKGPIYFSLPQNSSSLCDIPLLLFVSFLLMNFPELYREFYNYMNFGCIEDVSSRSQQNWDDKKCRNSLPPSLNWGAQPKTPSGSAQWRGKSSCAGLS